MRRASIAWFVIGLAACNAIAGLDGEFSADGDAGAPTLGTSSGTSSASSGASTSSSSSSSSSASSTSSSSSSSSSGGVDAGLKFCARPEDKPNDLCRSFDENLTPPMFGATSAYPDGPDTATSSREIVMLAAPEGNVFRATCGPEKDAALLFGPNTYDTANKHTVEMSFRFKIDAASFYGVIGALEMSNKEHGLAVTTTNCNGPSPCLIENTPSGRTPLGAARKAIDAQWHDAKIVMTYGTAWKGDIYIDSVLFSTRTTAIVAATQSKTWTALVGTFYTDNQNAGSTNNVLIDNLKVVVK